MVFALYALYALLLAYQVTSAPSVLECSSLLTACKPCSQSCIHCSPCSRASRTEYCYPVISNCVNDGCSNTILPADSNTVAVSRQTCSKTRRNKCCKLKKNRRKKNKRRCKQKSRQYANIDEKSAWLGSLLAPCGACCYTSCPYCCMPYQYSSDCCCCPPYQTSDCVYPQCSALSAY